MARGSDRKSRCLPERSFHHGNRQAFSIWSGSLSDDLLRSMFCFKGVKRSVDCNGAVNTASRLHLNFAGEMDCLHIYLSGFMGCRFSGSALINPRLGGKTRIKLGKSTHPAQTKTGASVSSWLCSEDFRLQDEIQDPSSQSEILARRWHTLAAVIGPPL